MKILLIISGSIASYKALLFIREAEKRNHNVTCVLTKAGEKFITPLSVSSLSKNPIYINSDFFSCKNTMIHIKLSRESDVILVLPSTADIIAKFANGIADELATTILITATIPIIMLPAMNPSMWLAKSTQRNVKQLLEDGIDIIDPKEGDLACGEYGIGAMEENIDKIMLRIHKLLNQSIKT